MAEIVGKTASLKMGSNVIDAIRSWTLDYAGDALEKTDFADSGHRTYLAGLDGWTGSFEGFGYPGWDTDATLGTTYKGMFYVDSAAGHRYSGSVIVTGVHPSVSVDGMNVISYDFQGSGVLGYA